MANTPISGLPAGGAITDTNLFADVQAVGVGPTKVTALQIKQYVGNNLTLTGTPILPQTFTIGTVSYTWPAANGTAGSVLTNNGAGGLSWTTTSLGTVTSVGLDASPVGLIVANSPITSSGNLVITGGVLNVANGGTGASTPGNALINLLPATSPATAGYALCNDGTGLFYWAATGGGGGGGGVTTFSGGTTGLQPAAPSSGNITLTGTLAVANGGTGQTTILGARNAILPAQGGNAGKVLGTDGTTASWVAVTGTGTVTSVSMDPSTTGLTVNGSTGISTITASGTFQLGGILNTANGGTGLSALGAGVQTALGIATNTSGGFLLAGVGGVLPIAQGGTNATTANAALNNLLPSQATNSGKVLTTDGTNSSWQAASGVSVTSFSAGTTGLTPNTPTLGAIVLGGTLSTANGGTGVNASAASNGQILIGNGAGFTLATLTAGTGITIDNSVPGAITINSTGGGGAVASVDGGATGLTPATPATGVVSLGGTLNVGHGGTGLTSTPTNGQLLIGNGLNYSLNTLTGGTNITIDNTTPGAITINGPAALVSSINFGSTGLTPSTATSGAVVVAGTLAIGSGGTGLATVGVNGSALVSNGTSLAYGNPLYATNLVGATVNAVPYQSAANTTAFAGPGAAGTYLAGNGAAVAPSFKAATLTLGATALNLNTTTTAITGMTGITMAAGYTPAAGKDVADKDYVDSITSPVNRLAPVDYATTPADGNQTLTGAATIDGTAVTTGMRVLVKDQTLTTEDGVYVVNTGGAWTRATDLDQQAEFDAASAFVLNGLVNKNTSWIQTLPATAFPPTQSWAQQSGIFTYSAGTGISIAGTTINNAGVLSFDGGTTGLTPAASTTGAITLAGTLNIANGGTSATTAQGARTNILPTQAGQNGKFLQTNGTDVVWATSSGGAVYYINITSTGTLPLKISGAGYTDSAGNSYVLYNSTASNVTLTATSFPNFASFTDCTATSIVLGAGKTMMVTTTVASSTYAIDASNYLSGGIFVATPNASSTIVNIINGIPAIDNEGNLYAIENTSNAPIVISGLTVDNPSSYPGYTQTNSVTIPAYGEALLLTTTTSANYVVLSLSNSVSTNLSGGSQNRIVYQTAANQTDFLPTGTSGQVLLSGGAGAAPTWGTATSAHYIPVSTNQTVSAAITAASIIDTTGAVYVFYNSDTSAHTLTTTSWDNYQSWPVEATSTVLTLQPKQTATIVTNTAGTNYSVAAVSSLSNAMVVTALAGGTISSIVTATGVEYNGLLVNIQNGDTNPITLTATTIGGYEAYAPASTLSSIILDPGKNALLVCISAGNYQLLSLSTSNTTVVSTGANYTTSTAITGGMTAGELLMITNTASSSITVTAASFDNSASYPANSTSTVFTMGQKSTLTLSLASGTANNWQIVSYSSGSTSAVTTASADGTITSILTTANIVQQTGMLITIRNTIGTGAPISITGTMTNYQPWAPAASATGVYVQDNECVTIRVVTPGSAYDVINLTNQNLALNKTANYTLSDAYGSAGGLVAGSLLTITNTSSPAASITLTADLIQNGATWPVQSVEITPATTPPTYNKFTLPANGTVTLELTSSSASNWKIVSFEYPGMQAGAVAFAIGNSQSSAATLGASKVIDAITLFPVATYGTYDTASYINPQSYLDTATGVFQPLVAGYYQINATITQGAANTTPLMGVGIVKNWSSTTPNLIAFTADYVASTGGVNQGSNVSTVVYMNGTTDTLRVGLYISAGAWSANSNSNAINFSGSLVTQQKIINTSSGVYNVPLTSANNNQTVPAILAAVTPTAITDVVNNLYIMTNTDTANVTITATSFIGYTAYPSQATATSIVLTPGATLELQTVTIGTGYQIVILNTPINVGSVAFSGYCNFNAPANAQTTVTSYVVNTNPQNYFNPTTGRFTPKVAGYYQFNLVASGQAGGFVGAAIIKNGSITASPWCYNDTGGGNFSSVTPSCTTYMNGTTDYVEAKVTPGATGKVILTVLDGFLTNQTLTEVVGTTAAGRVSQSAAVTLLQSTSTKFTYNTVDSDPQSWWNAANNRFVPKIPGYYRATANICIPSTGASNYVQLTVTKNGATVFQDLAYSDAPGAATANGIVYMNGTTDYLEAYYYATAAGISTYNNNSYNNFQIDLVGANQAVPAVTTTKFVTARANGSAGDYCVVQLDNLKIGFKGTGNAYLWMSTVSGTAVVYGEITTAWYGGGAGAIGISNAQNQNPRNLTTSPDYFFSSGLAGQINVIITDETSGNSYRATWIVGYSYINMQVFLERLN